MKTIIALDTSTESCSIALIHQNQLFIREILQARSQAQHCLQSIDACLQEADVTLNECEAIAFGRGPGSFTGLRIGASCAQGLAVATGISIIPVSSLQALAQQAYRRFQSTQVIAALDARMGECYWAEFKEHDGIMMPISEEQVTAPNLVAVTTLACEGIGNIWSLYPEISVKKAHTALPHAEDVAWLAGKIGVPVPPELALPIYVRNNVTN